jgi:hypothetical protein
MERCNELCTKEATGACTLCDKLAERDRFEWKYFWQFCRKEFFLTLYRFFLVRIPSFIIWLALFYLVWTVFNRFLVKGDFTSILTSYLAITAISIAFASMTFTYSRTKNEGESEVLVSIGELFLYTSLSLVIALLSLLNLLVVFSNLFVVQR